jgi:hypothetical protein
MTAHKQMRVKGHTLIAEGKPFTKWADRIYPEVGPDDQTTITGRAMCSCGAMSDPLPSDRARIRWHAAHKQEVIANGTP